jgi:signal transduction histidine kinase
MNSHHVIEAAGIVTLGLVAYSYLVRWFEARPPAVQRWRPVAVGLVFGAVAVTLMISRIEVTEGRFVDARTVPIALVALVESTPAGALAAAMAAAYRIWQGGSGATAGVLGIAATFAAAAIVRRWARRDGGIGLRHSLALTAAVWLITAGSFVFLGARGVAMFTPVWLPMLMLHVIGIGLVARLFAEVVAAQAAQRAQQEAARLRAVTMLANAAAHEINNPLMVVLGGLSLVARGLTADSEQAKWAGRAKEAAEQIRDIVGRMNEITSLEEVARHGALPPMLDIKRSSAPQAP